MRVFSLFIDGFIKKDSIDSVLSGLIKFINSLYEGGVSAKQGSPKASDVINLFELTPSFLSSPIPQGIIQKSDMDAAKTMLLILHGSIDNSIFGEIVFSKLLIKSSGKGYRLLITKIFNLVDGLNSTCKNLNK
jgi:hypothetical protein